MLVGGPFRIYLSALADFCFRFWRWLHQEIMKQGDAWTKVRAWFDEYGRTVRFALTRYGVPADHRPDLVQEVFSTAYFALVRDEQIEHPRAWLRGVARGLASNFRRKAGHAGHELVDLDEAAGVVDPGPSTDKQVEDRERLRLIFERMDLEAQEILLDVHMERMSFEDIALERGISVSSAKYLYHKAVLQAEDAVKSLDSKSRAGVMLPLAFIKLIDSVRAESEISLETHSQILKSLERRLDAGKLGGKDQPEADHATASPSRMSPISIRITNPAASWHGPALIALVSGLAIGGIFGWLLHTPKSSEPAPSDMKRTTPTLAEAESSSPPLAPPVATFASTDSSPVPTAEGTQSHPRTIAPLSDEQRLLDRALAGIATGKTLSALDALTEHARRFPKSHAATRGRILVQVCDIPAARGAMQCSGVVSKSALH